MILLITPINCRVEEKVKNYVCARMYVVIQEMENIIIYLKANAWEDQQWFFGLGPLMADVSNNIQLCQAPFTQMGAGSRLHYTTQL